MAAPLETIPVCRHCEYSLEGLPGHICPECGGDVRPPPPPAPPPAHWARRSQRLWAFFVLGSGAFWAMLLAIPMRRSYFEGYTHPGEDAMMVVLTGLVGLHAIGLFLVLRRRHCFRAIDPRTVVLNAIFLLVVIPMILFVILVPVL